MEPAIDFPLVMNYRAEEQQSSRSEAKLPFTLHASPSTTNYFYFLNGHSDVTCFSDANFTEEEIESYEYTPWGVLLTSASKNNLLYTARELDLETGLQFNRYGYYMPNLSRYNAIKFKLTKNKFIFKNNLPTNTYSSNASGSDEFWDCVYSCYDQRNEWENECYDDYIMCVNNCYDFEPPEVTAAKGIGVIGPIKGKYKFPQLPPSPGEEKEDDCNCEKEYNECILAGVPAKVTDCIDNCANK